MHAFRLRSPSGALPNGPRIDGFRFNMGRLVCGPSNPIVEVRGTSCWALDLEFDAEEDVVRELHSHFDL